MEVDSEVELGEGWAEEDLEADLEVTAGVAATTAGAEETRAVDVTEARTVDVEVTAAKMEALVVQVEMGTWAEADASNPSWMQLQTRLKMRGRVAQATQ